MDAEEILSALTPATCGLYQWLTFLKLGLVYLRGVWPVFAIMFMGADPGYECKLPTNTTDRVFNDGQCNLEEEHAGRNVTEGCKYGYTYGDQFDSTILTEFELVCEKNYMVELSTTIYMIGNALGAALISPLADRYGRKRVMLVCLWLQGVLGVAAAFVHSYIAFVILRFAVGLLNMAIALITYVMVTELFDSKHRTVPSAAMSLFWACGIISLALFGYLVRDWRHMELLITVPNFLTILYIWFLPESIPWLVVKGRWKTLDNVLYKAASQNNINLPDHLRHIDGASTANKDYKSTNGHSADIGVICTSYNPESRALGADHTHIPPDTPPETKPKPKTSKDSSIPDLFRSAKIRRYTLVMFYLWFVNSLAYFGILFSTPALHGDIFVNLAISGAVEIPAGLLCMFVLEKTGRRRPLVCFMLLCGVMNIVTIFIPAQTESGYSLEWLIICLSMIGKFAITGSYSTVYLMAAEIFPTSVRNQAVGMSSFFENCGSISAPFIVYWAKAHVSLNLPVVIFGSLTILGGVLALLLPETHNRALPDDLRNTQNHSTVPGSTTESKEPIFKTA